MVKFLVVNTLKSTFFIKSIVTIIGGINLKFSVTGVSILCIFVTSLYDSYNNLKEYVFMDQDDNHFKFLYFFHFIHFFSSCLLGIGYLTRNYTFNGLIYILFILIFILILYIISTKKNTKLYPFSYLIKNSYNELFLFHQANLLTQAVEKKTISRDVLLNLMSYYSQFETNGEFKFNFFDENNNIINTEDLDYYLYQTIDYYYKIIIRQNINSILIKISYSNFLRHKLKRFTKAYIILNDIIEGNFYLSPSQDFYFYRLKRKIEDRFIETGIDSSEISIKYQCNSFIRLISKISEIYLNFWNLLLNGKSDDNISLLSEFGNEINNLMEEIIYKYNYISQSKIKNKKIILLYGYFLRDILNDVEESHQILTEELIKEAKDEDINSLEYDIESIIPNSSFQYMIVSAKKGQIGIIKKISVEFCKKIGYSEKDLIGHNINIMIPDFLREEHQILLNNLLDNIKYREDNLSLPAIFNHCVFCKTISKFLVEIDLEVRIGFDEELIPFLLCKLNIDKDLFNFKKSTTTFHILTNDKFIIQNFTPNCLDDLSLSYKSINNNTELITQIKEYHEEYFRRAINIKKKEKRYKIKYSILKSKYMTSTPVEVITWLKNNKQFMMNCRPLKMNGKLLGFFFQFVTNKNISEYNSSFQYSSKNPSDIRRFKFEKRISLNIYRGNLLNLDDDSFQINKSYIPNSNKLDFDIKKREYLLRKDTSDKKNKDFKTIESFFKEKYLSKIKTRKNSDEEYSEETDEEEYESEENYSSSFSSLDEKDNEKNKVVVKKNKRESIKKKNEDFYNVKLKNISYFIYDYNINMPIEIKCDLIGKIDELLSIEKKKTFKFLDKNKSKEKKNNPHIINKFKKQFANKAILNIVEKQRIKDVNDTIKGLNDYFYQFKSSNLQKFFFIITFFCIISFITIIYSIISLLSSKTNLYNLTSIFIRISDLIENSHMTIYNTYELILLENNKYTNFFEKKEEKITKTKKKLLNIYHLYSNFSSLLNSNDLKLSGNNLKKIKSLNFDYYQIDSNGYYHKVNSPFLNILLEFTVCIYNIALRVSDNSLNWDVNFYFIMFNCDIFSLTNLEDFKNIFIDQFSIEKKRILIHLIIIFIMCFILKILLTFFEYKIYKNVLKENENYIKYFFKIDDEHIKYSIFKCKKYSMLNQENSSNVKYLIATPIINFGTYNDNESEDDSLLNLSKDNIIISQKNQNSFNIQKNNENLKKKRNKEIIKFLNINIFIYIIYMTFLIILLIIYHNKAFRLSVMRNIYYLLLSKKDIIIEYVNYLRLYIGYQGETFSTNYIVDGTIKLNSSLNYIINNISIINSRIYGNITKYGVSSNTTKIFKYILSYSLCDFLDNFTYYYNFTCDELGFNISKYGLNSIYIYIAHSINQLASKCQKIIEYTKSKGYYYNEGYYNSPMYEHFYPSDKSLKEDYEKNNPFLLFNDIIMRDLNIINEYIYNPATSYLRDTINGETEEIIKVMNNYIVIIGIICIIIIVLFYIIYLIPLFISKINQINKTRKMIKIIPKDILCEIIKKEQKINEEEN